MAITSANQLELLQTAEAVAREKMIDPVLVFEAREEDTPKEYASPEAFKEAPLGNILRIYMIFIKYF